MGFFKKLFKGFKKLLKAPFKLIQKAFKGDPLSIAALAASIYGGYSLLAKTGLTAAGAMAAKGSTDTAMAGLGASRDLFDIGMEAASSTGSATGAAAGAVASSVADTAGKSLFSTAVNTAKDMMGSATTDWAGINKEIASNVAASAVKNSSSPGLFGKISNWWHGLDNKEKLLAASIGLRTVGGFMKGYSETQQMNKLLKLKEQELKGFGHLTINSDKYFKLKKQAKLWYETDPALQKRVNSIMQRLEDPEYARGFYTLAGLLANPKAASFIKNDPYASLYS